MSSSTAARNNARVEAWQGLYFAAVDAQPTGPGAQPVACGKRASAAHAEGWLREIALARLSFCPNGLFETARQVGDSAKRIALLLPAGLPEAALNEQSPLESGWGSGCPGSQRCEVQRQA